MKPNIYLDGIVYGTEKLADTIVDYVHKQYPELEVAVIGNYNEYELYEKSEYNLEKARKQFEKEYNLNKKIEGKEVTQNNAEIMCDFIADLFTNEAEDLYSNFESFTDWCEGGDVFRNADFPEDKCLELDTMLKEVAPLVDDVSNTLYKYVNKD